MVGSINANDKICCEAAKAVIDSKNGEAAHMDKSWTLKPITKALSITKFKHEENWIIKMQRIIKGNIES